MHWCKVRNSTRPCRRFSSSSATTRPVSTPQCLLLAGELRWWYSPDLESSRQSFTMLLSQYPDNSKAPDALYKLGKVQCMKGNRERRRNT